ncbi:hypothetical protein ABIC75_001467 [Dyella japonica]|uniref:Transmembrane protein n=1 Tax=Dyella japonica TaxID=231455 RepID=A0ABV2JTX2_9GAMM
MAATVFAKHRTSPSPLAGEGRGEGRVLANAFLPRAFAPALRGPRMTAAGGWRKARRVAARMRPVFRQDKDVLSKNPVTRPRTFRPKDERRVIRGAVSFGIATISVVTFLYSGRPALRPSGRLRRSHALLCVRGQAKKSDPGRGSGSEARRRRARSPQRDNRMQSHWMTSHSAVEKAPPASAGMTSKNKAAPHGSASQDCSFTTIRWQCPRQR